MFRKDINPDRVRAEIESIAKIPNVRDPAGMLCSRLDLKGEKPDAGHIRHALTPAAQARGIREAEERRAEKAAKEFGLAS